MAYHTHHRASSSKSDENPEFEELNREQQLKAALYHGIKQISKEVEEDMEMRISSQVLATLCESLNRQAQIYAVDLELFVKHGKRTNVSVDDVKLLARRNQQLLQHLNSIAAELAMEKGATKKAGKAKDKSKTKARKGTPKAATASVADDVDVAVSVEVDED